MKLFSVIVSGCLIGTISALPLSSETSSDISTQITARGVKDTTVHSLVRRMDPAVAAAERALDTATRDLRRLRQQVATNRANRAARIRTLERQLTAAQHLQTNAENRGDQREANQRAAQVDRADSALTRAEDAAGTADDAEDTQIENAEDRVDRRNAALDAAEDVAARRAARSSGGGGRSSGRYCKRGVAGCGGGPTPNKTPEVHEGGQGPEGPEGSDHKGTDPTGKPKTGKAPPPPVVHA